VEVASIFVPPRGAPPSTVTGQQTELERRCLCPPVTAAQTPRLRRGAGFSVVRGGHTVTPPRKPDVAAAAAARATPDRTSALRAPNERQQRFAWWCRAVAKAPLAGNSNHPKSAFSLPLA